MNWESINRFLTIFNVILALINVILVLKQLQKSPNIILKLENKKRILENIWNATLYNWIVYLEKIKFKEEAIRNLYIGYENNDYLESFNNKILKRNYILKLNSFSPNSKIELNNFLINEKNRKLIYRCIWMI